jgi:GNAT superfamily N-acetyltransferase
MILRDATSEDVLALHAMVERGYRGDTARKGWTHEADLLGGQRTDPAALAETIAHPDQLILLASDGDTLAGCVQISKVADDRAYLGLLTVDPVRQAKGLGAKLIAAAEYHAVAGFGARAIEMTVIRLRKELIAYYERRGYALTGEERPFPLDDPRFGLPRTRDLAFVVLLKALPAPPSPR